MPRQIANPNAHIEGGEIDHQPQATDRQISFLTVLLRDREAAPGLHHLQLSVEEGIPLVLGKADASRYIDTMLQQPPRAPEARWQAAPAIFQGEDGLYLWRNTDGSQIRFIKIETDSHRQRAKGWRWDEVPDDLELRLPTTVADLEDAELLAAWREHRLIHGTRVPGHWDEIDGLLSSLARGRHKIEPLSADAAALFGRITGNCVFCARPLSRPESLYVGYGPICAEKNALPWGVPEGDKHDARA